MDFFHFISRAWCAAFVLLAAGCGSDGDGGGGSEPGEEIIAVAGSLINPDSSQSAYLALVPDLEAGTEVDLENALEVPGGGFLAAPGDSNQFYVLSNERPVVERWLVDEDGAFVLDDEMGLTQLGIGTVAARNPIHFIAEDRAYLVDVATRRVVVWDPSAMETRGSFSIGGLERDGLTAGSNNILRDGNRLVLTLRYFRPDESAEVVTTAVFIDTNSESVSYAEDRRCGNIVGGILAENGDMYFASHTSQAARLRAGEAGEPAGAPCMLRIRRGAEEFDPTFYVEMNDLTGGRPTGFLIPGGGNNAYVLAYDEQIIPITDQPAARLTQLPAWTYWAVDLDSDLTQAREIESLPPGAAFGFNFVIDGTPYLVSVGAAFQSGTIYDISDPDNFVEGLTAPGIPGAALRIR